MAWARHKDFHVRFPLLGKLVDALQFCSTTFFHKVLFTCMYLVAFAAFRRLGEVTISGGNKENELQFNNIQFNQETGGGG